MDALRVRSRLRLAPLLEWAAAVLLLGAGLWLGSRAIDAVRTVPERPPAEAVARPLAMTVPLTIPPRAVSVPVLPFKDGKELRVGETLRAVALRLGRAAELGVQDLDRGAFGERLTRFYEYGGARFILVFEPLRAGGDPRLAAIYLP
jgi:hypothetical protein